MKAVVFRKGAGLVTEETPAPAIEEDQVLIRVSDTGFCGSDHTLVESGGMTDGYIMCHETSGTVVETGAYSNTHDENIRCLRWTAEGRLDGRPLISHLIPLAELPRVYREKIRTGRAIKVMVRIGPSFKRPVEKNHPFAEADSLSV